MTVPLDAHDHKSLLDAESLGVCKSESWKCCYVPRAPVPPANRLTILKYALQSNDEEGEGEENHHPIAFSQLVSSVIGLCAG